MATEKENPNIDITNPLYLHPNEGPLFVSEKLQGITNYRSWNRPVEIALAGKRKLGFVTGLVTRDPTDKKKKEQWDICNSIVISWLHAFMSEPIKKSVLYFDNAGTIWKQLEKRFTKSLPLFKNWTREGKKNISSTSLMAKTMLSREVNS
ncbi:Retrovirus-related Pol polyprotein from transposon RE1 [Bienertia sinuspersici]